MTTRNATLEDLAAMRFADVRPPTVNPGPWPRPMAPGEVWTGETCPSPTMLAAALAAALGVAPAPNRGDDLHGSTATPIDYEQIDSGVRRLVRWLNEHGYETPDSGDGVSGGLDEPYVVLRSTRSTMVDDADRLAADLASAGVVIGHPVEGAFIQATYCPGDGYALLTLWGVSDAALPAEAAPETTS